KLGALLESVAIDWPRRWTALKLLENNRAVEEELKSAGRPEILEQAALCRELLGPAPQSKIIAALYRFAHQIAKDAVAGQNNDKKTLTEKLDGIILHRLAAFPIMLATLGTIFAITLFGAAPLSDWLGTLFAWLAETAKNVLVSRQAPFWLVGMLVDGLITGLGAVISVMLPTMAIFFVIFALLEDAGFVPRLAFLMDRPMKAVGSQGKHCVSCLLAFGCSIPAVYSTRIMAGSHRLLAMLTCSLLPCNGRLGVMLAATGVFFGSYAPLVMVALIALAAAAMMAGTFLLHRIFFRGDNPSFILELPPYRLPRLRPVIVRTLREKVWHVLSRAALLAAPITVTIWLLSNLPAGPSPTITQQLARLLEPAGLFFGLDGKT
ncbi:MAG: ferrous iron transporter B, partial [Moorella sp. (in: Bacteria)]|nr:ferrous iron transporter B [Moorella sp. (in: firmicutes)]